MIIDALLSWMLSAVGWLQGFADSHLTGTPFDPVPIAQGWAKVLDLDFFLPIHELFLFTLAVFALGPAALLTSVIVWLMVGVVRGGAVTV